ncbi:MAG: threonine--tRNA ligase [Chloroflexi bacterium]|nr:threonine--tRNA ligase [Chloroflexota bacterium]
MTNQNTSAELADLRSRMRHSAAHVLAEVVLDMFPEAQLTIGPPTQDGFYYDFAVDTPFTPEDLKKIERQMRKSIGRNHPFVEREVSRSEAAEIVKDNAFKLEILEGIPEDETVTFCAHGDFEDLCRGGHVESTGQIKAVKLLTSSGAYWRGDENNPMLQRIYGTAWESKDAQQAYIDRVAEAEKRDHRKLGPQLGLFFFDSLAPASPFYLPKGTHVFNSLVNFVKDLYGTYGYQEVMTPQIYNTELWKTSGHYEAYHENMFTMDVDGREFGVKPMNCPPAMMVYKSDLRSYRDLPIRWADFSRLHRYEQSGATHGLTRTRAFTQDDAHIFCTRKQIGSEVKGFIDMLVSAYKVFGFDTVRFALSLRPEKRIGSDELWDEAEEILENLLSEFGIEYERMSGEGAFYGPKIDVFAPDAIGREWQLGTVQLDFNQPDRFGLEYVEEDGSRQRPAMIHRAMLGSIERFLGVWIEHIAGAFPVWIAPVQAVVVPITDRNNDYCHDVAKSLAKSGVRIEVDDSSDRMNAKIRKAQLQKVPYMLVVGDREQETGEISVRLRSGEDLGSMPVASVESRIAEEVADFK